MMAVPKGHVKVQAMPLHITVHTLQKKLDSFISINTSVKENPFCRLMHTQKSIICGNCYAFKMVGHYIQLERYLVENYRRLLKPLSKEEIAITCEKLSSMHTGYIRLNSLGELSGPENLLNYYRICEGVREARFALYTKRADLIKRMNGKPLNLSIIWSNHKIDAPSKKIPYGCNGTFNILSYDYCIENKISPSCKRECRKCLRCYSGKQVVVTELLKLDQSRIERKRLPPLDFNWDLVSTLLDEEIPKIINGKKIVFRDEILDLFLERFPRLNTKMAIPRVLDAICKCLRRHGCEYYNPNLVKSNRTRVFYVQKPPLGLKTCLNCKEDKPLSDFSTRDAKHIKKERYCKECHRKMYEDKIIQYHTPSDKWWKRPWEHSDYRLFVPKEWEGKTAPAVWGANYDGLDL